MKSVLISIQPKWCELIASGKKILEVRKTKPKIETPFKCYIYCTQRPFFFYKSKATGKLILNPIRYRNSILNANHTELNGKVIGEFVCDAITADKTFGHNALFKTSACMSDADVSAYCLSKEMYCWHISDLVIYDEPKELGEFFKACNKPPMTDCSVCLDSGDCVCGYLKRPPQSWCYVEEVQE